MNGLEIGQVLQTNNIFTIGISFEMWKKLCSDLLENKRKICIIVDESTTMSQKTMLVIYLKAAVANNNEVGNIEYLVNLSNYHSQLI